MENKTKTLATKEDVALLKEDLASLRVGTKQDIGALRLEFAEFRLETKQEFAAIRLEFAAARSETKQEFSTIRSVTSKDFDLVREEIGAVRASIAKLEGRIEAKLENRIGESKAEIIKWMFIFWVSQLLAIFSFIMLFIKK